MYKTETSPIQLEILVSTLNRNSLDFLEVMFQNNTISDYQILVINQTSEDCTLHSNDSNIRIINSYEKGLSKSRNLAIENAIGHICLLADDDIVYIKGFEKPILESYSKLDNADVITFQTLTTESRPYSNYPKQTLKLKGFSKMVLSIEITFKRESIVKSSIRFNEHFGLGATFQDSENYIFLTDLMKLKKINLFFAPEFIVIHKPFSSSGDIVSDRFMFARSALYYKLYGNAVYIYVLKLIFYLLRKKLIKFDEIGPKFRVAHSAIKTYKQLNIQ
ncbi:MAG: glycosyltransferase family A protein [Gelidibacter sp.]